MSGGGDAITMRGYLAVFRRQRWLILLVTVVAAGAAFAYTTNQTPRYTATSTINFRDESQDLAALGTATPPLLQPAQFAASRQGQVTQPAVLQKVKEAVHSPLSLDELRNSITTSVDPVSALVQISAKSRRATQAALLANQFAVQTRAYLIGTDRARYAAAARQLQAQLRRTGRKPKDAAVRAVYADRISRLVTLSTFARPVDLLKSAQVPSAPTSPKPLLSTLLAALLGFVIGTMLGFLRNSLDRRSRSSEEIAEQLELPVVGHVRKKALGTAGTSGGGRRRSLDVADLEAFRILRTNLALLDVDTPKRSVLVTSALPEEGKSTVACALAEANVVAGKRTLLVECDLRRPSLAKRLNVARSPGLTDYLAGMAASQEILRTVNFMTAGAANGNASHVGGTSPGTLTLITAGTQCPNPAELIGSKRFHDFLLQVCQSYEAVVIDSSPLLPVVDTREMLTLVDAILVCVRLDQTHREQMRAVKLEISRFPAAWTGLVITGMSEQEQSEYGYYSDAYTSALASG